jgi:excisionase family DNA binding protein
MECLFYTARSAAELLECSKQTVQRLCNRGELRAYKRLRKWYILQTDLIAYIKQAN